MREQYKPIIAFLTFRSRWARWQRAGLTKLAANGTQPTPLSKYSTQRHQKVNPYCSKRSWSVCVFGVIKALNTTMKMLRAIKRVLSFKQPSFKSPISVSHKMYTFNAVITQYWYMYCFSPCNVISIALYMKIHMYILNFPHTQSQILAFS